MRLAIAGFHIESASFLPAVSRYEDFERNAHRGNAIIEAYEGTNSVIGGFIDVCRARGIGMAPLVYTYLGALGPAEDRAVERYAEEIATTARHCHDLDGILLHLHGASWAPGYQDPERHILEKIRAAVGPDMPLIVAFDYHGNIDRDTIRGATAAFAYQKSPHTDMADTGRRAAGCMARMLTGELAPAMAIARPGLLTPSIFSATGLHPLADILAEAREMERRSPFYLDISVMAGFSYADAPNTGFSVIAVSGGGAESAEAAVAHLAQRVRDERERLYRPEPIHSVEQAVTRAMAQAPRRGKPVVLLEHADRLNDSTYVLAELIARKAQNAAVPFLWDPQAAHVASEAGPGALVTLKVGGQSSAKAGPRLEIECEVLQAEEKSYDVSGAMLQGTRVDLGQTALLRCGGITISVVSRPAFGVDEDAFTVFGQDPRDYDIIVLRSKTHFRQVYEALAREIIIVDTPDYGPADLTQIPYRHLDITNVYPFCPVSA
jgi:microcystin degradation protein MlrC